jgi:uncharacterized protein (DUF362 family)
MEMTTVEFTTYKSSVKQALDAIGARAVLATQESILIKPNLVNASPFPVTTPPAMCAAIIGYVRSCSQAQIVIAEGCGASNMDTDEVFKALGYDQLAKEKGVGLVDLNTAATRQVENESCRYYPKMLLPEIVFTHFLISVPVLKAHSYTEITGSLKNMMGILPPKYYGRSFGGWKKEKFHRNLHESIVELNGYRTADLSIMDATAGLADFHLGGRQCSPAVNKIVAGYDALQVDRAAASLLGYDWRTISHLAVAGIAQEAKL